MKKLVSLFLAAVMLLSMATFATAEDDKPYKGQHLLIWNDFGNNLIQSFDVWGQPVNAFAAAYAAIVEWCEANECTFTLVGKGADQFASAVAGGNQPDLVITYNTFPNYAVQDLIQPLTDAQEATLREKFGDGYVDPMMHMGDAYGVVQPWGGNYVILYNRTMMEDMGIKTPREYYLEDNWTYETFEQVMKDCTQDIDGDGKLDTQAVYRNSFNLAMGNNIMWDQETGRWASALQTERAQEFYQMLYNSYTLNNAIHLGSGPTGLASAGKDGAYVMMKFQQQNSWQVNQLLYTDKDGYVIEGVPVPNGKQGDTEQTQSLNYTYINIAKGAKNADAAFALMNHIMECGLVEMAQHAGVEVDFDFEGLVGNTEETKTFIAERQAKINELAAASLALPEYDADYMAKVTNFYLKEAKYYMTQIMSGVSTLFDQKSECYTLPTATFIAQTDPVLQAQMEAFYALCE